MKDLATLFQFLQDYVARRDIDIKTDHTSTNVPKMLTKTVPSSTMLKLMGIMKCNFASSGASLALLA